MVGLIVRRLALALLVMVLVAAITFTMLHALRPESFFDPRPLGTQLLDYLEAVFLHLDFGRTRGAPRPEILGLLREGLGPSISLLAGGFVVGLALGLAGGMIAAARERTLVARAIEVAALFALCAPVYWVGLMLQVLFAPVGGQFSDFPLDVRQGNYAPLSDDPKQWLDSLFIPWLVLGAPLAGMCVRMMRASSVEALQQDFVRTARAKGLGGAGVLRRHVLPAGAAPTVSLAGANVPLMVTNLILVEAIFNVPGVFRYTTGAMNDGEFEVLQALVIVGAFLVVAGNLLVDVVLGWLDPRVRSSS
jgi:peptide/nickel transport system permease protein